jgi:hypothetical protein
MISLWNKTSNAYRLFIIYAICLISFQSILGEEVLEYDRQEFIKNFKRVIEFKKNMPSPLLAYYKPRKKYIDRQSVNPFSGSFYQIHIISRGAYFRARNLKKNLKEILKLEKFLEGADDFELSRYFSDMEEIYLRSSANKSIAHIKEEARRDELWRKRNDPIFASYLENKANSSEKAYYKKNKSKFFCELTGKKLIKMLQDETIHEKNKISTLIGIN